MTLFDSRAIINYDRTSPFIGMSDSNQKFLRCLNMSGQWLNTHHRSGWPYVIQCLYNLHDVKGVTFEGFIEKKFAWGRDYGDAKNNFQAFSKPWVGVLHNPPNIPDIFNLNNHSPQDIFASEFWKMSSQQCLGIFTFSDYLSTWLKANVNVPVESLVHPTGPTNVKFSFDKFRNNRRKRILHLGWWLRRFESFYKLNVEGYQKNLLKIDEPHVSFILQQEIQHLTKFEINSVKVVDYLSNSAYDSMFVDNVVFIDLYDSSANNTIVECIERECPIVVNPLQAVMEYLGKDYPLYFNTLEEAESKLQNFKLLHDASIYLRDLRNTKMVHGDFFLKSICNSSIYVNILNSLITTTIITSVYRADDDIEGYLLDITRQTVFERCELVLYNFPETHVSSVYVKSVIENFTSTYPNISYREFVDDLGLYETWNMQIKNAKGEFIAMGCIDDRRAPNYLQRHLETFKEFPDVDVVSCAVYSTLYADETWESNSAYRTFGLGFNWQTSKASSLQSESNYGVNDLFYLNDANEIVDSDCLPHCMPVWRKALHEKFGFFEEAEFGPLSDWEFWVRCGIGGAKFRLLSEILGLYFENPTSHNRRTSSEHYKLKVIKMFKDFDEK